jgi:hypothetical protein
MFIAVWIVIVLEIILLLIWAYQLFFSSNATDPAGSGIAQFLVILSAGYIGLGIYFMTLQKNWATVVALIMGLIPIAAVGYMLIKNYSSRP